MLKKFRNYSIIRITAQKDIYLLLKKRVHYYIKKIDMKFVKKS